MSSRKHRYVVLCFLFATGLAGSSFAADWPMYGCDSARSGSTTNSLAFPLRQKWVYEPAQAPRPAWPEPGKELHRLDFDYGFVPVAACGMVFFGSSADDTVRALDAKSGRLVWQFTADAPFRFAPSVAGGKLYAASDDGRLYCLDARTGEQIWQFRAAPRDRLIVGNGRLISRWPLRSGVLVVDGVAYVTAGMWPSQGVFTYALDAAAGEEIWCNDSSGNIYTGQPHCYGSGFSGVSPQGYLAVCKDKLIVPTGRSVPARFDIRTGKLFRYDPGYPEDKRGGSWVTAVGDHYCTQHNGQSSPYSEVQTGEADPIGGDSTAVFDADTGHRALSLPGYRTVTTGMEHYCAGLNAIYAIDLKWRRTWEVAHSHERVYSMALAGNALFLGGRELLTAIDLNTRKQVWSLQMDGQVRGLAIADGRVVATTGKGTVVCFEPGDGKGASVPPITEGVALNAAAVPEKHVQKAARIIAESGKTEGYALVIGEMDARLATAIALQTKLHIVCVTKDTAALAAGRQRLLKAGLYGSRIVLHRIDDFSSLPYPPWFADLVVVSEQGSGLSGKELYRVLRPCGGVMVFSGAQSSAVKRLVAEAKIPAAEISGNGLLVKRGRLPGAGEWRYQLANSGSTGVGDESLVRFPLDVLWFGGPGPADMVDRHMQTSSPLSANGRVFVTGQHQIIAFDAYTGRILWKKNMHNVGRRYALAFASNAVADDDSLYVTHGPHCYRLDAATGNTLFSYSVPEEASSDEGPVSEKKEKAKIIDIEWPTVWTVIGPFPKGSAPFAEDDLRDIPSKVEYEGRSYEAADLAAVNGFLDLTYLYGGYGLAPLGQAEKPGPYPRENASWDDAAGYRVAFAFATISVPEDGRLLLGAGSDWFMKWCLDGKGFFDTMKRGNATSKYAIDNHVFGVDVSAGEHVLAVEVRAGSKGWMLVSGSIGTHADKILPQAPKETDDYVHVDVEWPEVWQVVALPGRMPDPAKEVLSRIPEQIVAGGRTNAAAPVKMVDHVLDFSTVHQELGSRTSYAFADVNCRTQGTLLIGARGVSTVNCYVDGKLIRLFLWRQDPQFRARTHVWRTQVKAGDHVVVLKDAYSRQVTVMGGAQDADKLMAIPEEMKNQVWGYVSAWENMLLGTYVKPRKTSKDYWQSNSVGGHTLYRSSNIESSALFAINKQDGAPVWVHRSERTIPNNCVVFGDGKVFFLEMTAASDVRKARRRGKALEAARYVVALDLATGKELWRRDEVSAKRIDKGNFQYSNGILTVAMQGAYDGATGKELWRGGAGEPRSSIVHGDWLINRPGKYGGGATAWNLHTGEQRMEKHILTGDERPWRLIRACGCGAVSGCGDLLFMRSGSFGFFDMKEQGMANWGGGKPSCGSSMIAANGLVIIPESSSGCTCSYSFQTSLGLISSFEPGHFWYVFHEPSTAGSVIHVRTNVGAPGDRRDNNGFPWLGLPRPFVHGTAPGLTSILMSEYELFSRSPYKASVADTADPWIYLTGLRGEGKIGVDLIAGRTVSAPTCKAPPTVDGLLDDECWKNAFPAPFAGGGHRQAPQANLLVCRDTNTLYFAWQRDVGIRDGHPVPLVAGKAGNIAYHKDTDGLEIYLCSGNVLGFCFGLNPAGGKFQATTSLIYKQLLPRYGGGGPWTHAVSTNASGWAAEIALPLQTLTDLKIDPGKLRINCKAKNYSGQGAKEMFLVDPLLEFGRSQRFLPLADVPEKPAPERSFTVRLHFADLENAEPGRRVFDVTLQDQNMLKDFDIVAAAGASRAVVKEFTGVKGSDVMTIELTARSGSGKPGTMPIINGIEIVQEE